MLFFTLLPYSRTPEKDIPALDPSKFQDASVQPSSHNKIERALASLPDQDPSPSLTRGILYDDEGYDSILEQLLLCGEEEHYEDYPPRSCPSLFDQDSSASSPHDISYNDDGYESILEQLHIKRKEVAFDNYTPWSCLGCAHW